MPQCSQRQSSASVHVRTSAVFTRSPAQGPYDHQVAWGWFRRSFAGVIPSGSVNPENTNEMAHQGSRVQFNSRWSDVSPSRPRENANAQAVSTDSMGTWMSRWTLLAYVIGKSDLSKNNQDPYKGEIKIPPPHPYKRKNSNYFSDQGISLLHSLMKQ